jgi:hypothetical protein
MLKVKLSKINLCADDISEYERAKQNWTPASGGNSSKTTGNSAGSAMVVDNYKRKVHQRIGFPETDPKL